MVAQRAAVPQAPELAHPQADAEAVGTDLLLGRLAKPPDGARAPAAGRERREPRPGSAARRSATGRGGWRKERRAHRRQVHRHAHGGDRCEHGKAGLHASSPPGAGAARRRLRAARRCSASPRGCPRRGGRRPRPRARSGRARRSRAGAPEPEADVAVGREDVRQVELPVRAEEPAGRLGQGQRLRAHLDLERAARGETSGIVRDGTATGQAHRRVAGGLGAQLVDARLERRHLAAAVAVERDAAGEGRLPGPSTRARRGRAAASRRSRRGPRCRSPRRAAARRARRRPRPRRARASPPGTRASGRRRGTRAARGPRRRSGRSCRWWPCVTKRMPRALVLDAHGDVARAAGRVSASTTMPASRAGGASRSTRRVAGDRRRSAGSGAEPVLVFAVIVVAPLLRGPRARSRPTRRCGRSRCAGRRRSGTPSTVASATGRPPRVTWPSTRKPASKTISAVASAWPGRDRDRRRRPSARSRSGSRRRSRRRLSGPSGTPVSSNAAAGAGARGGEEVLGPGRSRCTPASCGLGQPADDAAHAARPRRARAGPPARRRRSPPPRPARSTGRAGSPRAV